MKFPIILILIGFFASCDYSEGDTSLASKYQSPMNGKVELSGEKYLFIETEAKSGYYLDEWSIDLLSNYLKKQASQNPEMNFNVIAGIYRSSSDSKECQIHFSEIINHSTPSEFNNRFEKLRLRIDENPVKLYLNSILQEKIKAQHLAISPEQINPQTSLYSILQSLTIDSIQQQLEKEIPGLAIQDSITHLEFLEHEINNYMLSSNKNLQLIDYFEGTESEQWIRSSKLDFWKRTAGYTSANESKLQKTVNLIDQNSDSTLFQHILSESNHPESFLLDGYWIFDHFTADSMRYSIGSAAILKFDIYNNTISGLNACNSIYSKFHLNLDSISFSTLASTQKFCVENNVVETALLKTLKSTNKFKVDDCYLELMKNDSIMLVFRKPIQVQNND